MSLAPQTIGLLGMLGLLVLIFIRVPVAVALGIVGFVGYAAIEGWQRALLVLGNTPFDIASGYALSVVPLFILMGALASEFGMSAKLFKAAKSLFNGFRGAEAMATIGACAGFAAVCGSSLATAATMSRIAIPEMRAGGYDDRLSVGVVAAGGTLGILLPPSIIFVIYAIIAQQSVLRLFAAGLIPGLVLMVLYMMVVGLLVIVRPAWAQPGQSLSLRQRLRDMRQMWEIALLFGVSIGGMYAGWFSPTEAAAIGAFGAFMLATMTGQMSLARFWICVRQSVQTTAMLFFIMIGAFLFSYFTVQTQLPTTLVALVRQAGLSPLYVMLVLIAIYIILGCFLDGIGMILVTVPIFFPLVVENGFDPVWFGVMLVTLMEIGLIHPPVGMNLFVIRAQIPDIRLSAIYLGVLPFLIAQAMLIVLLLAFPRMALWLPASLYGR
jgi:tripartite ATP-independent transporter DctM subunit